MRARRKGLEWFPLVVGGTTYAIRLDHGCPGRAPPGCRGRWTATAHDVPGGATDLAHLRAGDRRGRFPPVVALSAGEYRAPVLRALRERLEATARGRHPGGEGTRSRDREEGGRAMTFEPVARSEEVAGPRFLRREAHGRPVLLTRLADGTVVAFGHICPHQERELDEGMLWEGEIDCPHHHYTYDPRTGENLYPKRVFPASRAASIRGIPVFETRESDGVVSVRAPSDPGGDDPGP